MKTNYSLNKKAELIIKYLKKAPIGLVVEVGSIRNLTYEPNDGFSTYFIGKYCHENNIEFKSIELSPRHLYIANQILKDNELPEYVILGNGSEILPTFGPISFLFLDSHKYPSINLDQYKAAELPKGSIVIVDDAQEIDLFEFGKATFIKQVLDKEKTSYQIIATQLGWDSLVFTMTKDKKSGEY